MKPIEFLSYRIERGVITRRWYVLEYDWELGWREIGPCHSTKWKAMDWCVRQTTGDY